MAFCAASELLNDESEIDFSCFNRQSKDWLADEILSSLLARVNVKSVTRSINLNYYAEIKGSGLLRRAYRCLTGMTYCTSLFTQ